MKLLGITQRVDTIDRYHERRDSLDQRWWPLIEKLGFLPVPLPNISPDKTATLANTLDLSAIILTGGNSIHDAPERDAFETALIKWALENKKPIMGICRGLQMINHYFGGTLTAVENHVAVRHSIKFCGPWSHLSSREVNSYHEWGVFPEQLSTDLQATAIHNDGSIEALIHKNEKISALMWHPERENNLNPDDITLLKGLLT